ncbi:hypothetical protein CPEBRM1_ABPJDJAI_01415 [Companilactobacillus paralimentarius]|uniref:hypothetical protein n=1 Tax=Companilactobacillus paralimentarius TaxID=83526 RepID=UPI00384D7289
MLMKNFEKNIIEEKIASFGGLSSIGDGNNDKIEQYFHSFMDWLDFNNVLDVINRYAGINMNLQYVTSHDFLIWLLHYGDIYDNVLEKYFSNDTADDYIDIIREFAHLRSIHPKYSFTVALTHHLPEKSFLSDNDLDKLIPILASIPDNANKREDTNSLYGRSLFMALYSLNNFAIERVSASCI